MKDEKRWKDNIKTDVTQEGREDGRWTQLKVCNHRILQTVLVSQ
jgi:hypothetical protein